MARTPKNHDAAAELGKRLTTLNNARGTPKPKDIELWIAAGFGTHVSDETIRRAHKGLVDPLACDVELLLGLAAFYRVQPQDLGEHTARRLSRVLVMASGGDDPDLPDRDFAASRCTRPCQGTLWGWCDEPEPEDSPDPLPLDAEPSAA